MNRGTLFQAVWETYQVRPDYPWKDDNAVLRHRHNRKWFAVVLMVRRDRLGLSGGDFEDIVNVKLSPELVGFLRGRDGFLPAYHMNKEKWISIKLDGTVHPDELMSLLDESYRMTK